MDLNVIRLLASTIRKSNQKQFPVFTYHLRHCRRQPCQPLLCRIRKPRRVYRLAAPRILVRIVLVRIANLVAVVVRRVRCVELIEYRLQGQGGPQSGADLLAESQADLHLGIDVRAGVCRAAGTPVRIAGRGVRELIPVAGDARAADFAIAGHRRGTVVEGILPRVSLREAGPANRRAVVVAAATLERRADCTASDHDAEHPVHAPRLWGNVQKSFFYVISFDLAVFLGPC